MEKESTTTKGNRFEDKVHEFFLKLISNGDIGIGSRSQIFKKKSYYSEARKGNIIVDISIESYIGDAKQYSYLTIIECKNYSKSVPVNDIEEFCSKLNQIGEHNTKGIVVSNNSFQEGGLNIARSSGLGLIRINDSNEHEWINYRKDRHSKYIDFSKTSELLSDIKTPNINFVGFFGQVGYDSIYMMLNDMRIVDTNKVDSKSVKFPYLSIDAIERIVNDLPWDRIYEKGILISDKLCQYLQETYNVRFEFSDKLEHVVLGKISFNPLTVFVSSELQEEENRWRFTLAHEVGHLILHADKLMSYLNEYSDDDKTIFGVTGESDIQRKKLEFQANTFASHLLLPQDFLQLHVIDYFKRQNISRGTILLDNQPCNRNLAYNLLDELRRRFGVSKEVGKYRLIENKVLIDATDTSIRSIIDREY